MWRARLFIPLRVANTGLVVRDIAAEDFGRNRKLSGKSEVGLRSLLKVHAKANFSLGCSSVAERRAVNSMVVGSIPTFPANFWNGPHSSDWSGLLSPCGEPTVGGASPSRSTILSGTVAQLVERGTHKPKVTGANPVGASIYPPVAE